MPISPGVPRTLPVGFLAPCSLVRPKDPGPIEERKGVVYSIPCVECSSVYIGQTGRSLKQRISEHRRALKNGDVQTSALAEHVFKTGHAVDLSQSEVLDHHQHTTTRCMLESWYIQHNQAVMTDLPSHSGLYKRLLHLYTYVTQKTYLFPQTHHVGIPKVAAWQYADAGAAMCGRSTNLYNAEARG